MAVFGLVSAVAGFVKVRYLIDKAIIDNLAFRAHYRVTSAILFACCIIVTANNLIGKRSYSISAAAASMLLLVVSECLILKSESLLRIRLRKSLSLLSNHF